MTLEYQIVTCIVCAIIAFVSIYTVRAERKQTKEIIKSRNKSRVYSPSISDDNEQHWD